MALDLHPVGTHLDPGGAAVVTADAGCPPWVATVGIWVYILTYRIYYTFIHTGIPVFKEATNIPMWAGIVDGAKLFNLLVNSSLIVNS